MDEIRRKHFMDQIDRKAREEGLMTIDADGIERITATTAWVVRQIRAVEHEEAESQPPH